MSKSHAAFESAVKHLFRHLHEPHALRSNPFVRQLFEKPAIGQLTPSSEAAAIEKLHFIIRLGAQHHRALDLAAGKDERAHRQHVIITQQCLERRSIYEVAKSLGISHRHCYRERAAACQRIARYVCEHNNSRTINLLPELDEFQFLTDRAKQRASLGDRGLAFRACNDLVRLAPSIPLKIDALRTMCFVSLQLGDVQRAESAYDSARSLYSQRLASMPSSLRDAARARVDLMGAKLAYYQADSTNALRRAERATMLLESARTNMAEPVSELYVESIYELAIAFWNVGQFERSHHYISRAETYLKCSATPSYQLRTRIMADAWRLRNHVLLSSENCYPASQRLSGLTSTFEQARAAGALQEAIDSLAAIAEYHAFAGNDDEALRFGRFAIWMSNQRCCERLRKQTSTIVGTLLLFTRHAGFAFSLIPTREKLESCGPYYRELALYAAADRALRLQRFSDVFMLPTDSGEARYPTLMVRRKLVAASAAQMLERRNDAKMLIEMAIAAATKIESAPLLRDTYRTAAVVTGDARFKSRARELSRLLTA